MNAYYIVYQDCSVLPLSLNDHFTKNKIFADLLISNRKHNKIKSAASFIPLN